jgi:hypothetical protein
VRNLSLLSPVLRLAVWIRATHRRLLWVAALALWIEGGQMKVCALDAPHADAAASDSVSSPDASSASEKAGVLRDVVRHILSDPAKAPEIVADALGSPVAESTVFAGDVVCTAIDTLLRPVTRAQISALILAAVKARPAAVLAIVRAAVQCAPQHLDRDIVAAAVAGVPDPYRSAAGGKTLAESILDAAVNAGSGESRDALSAAIDSSLGQSNTPQDPVANETSVGTSATNGSEGSLAGNAAGGGFGGGGGGGGNIEDPLATITPTPSPSPTLVTAPTPTAVSILASTPLPTPFPTPNPTPFPEPTSTPIPVSP